MAQQNSVSQNELQKTFIAMLFAFAVSVVAQQIAEMLIVITSNWKSALLLGTFYSGLHDQFWSILSVASHLFLALLMLSVSWVMWSRSQAAGHINDITDIFSVKFITFLVEIALVILYFSLAKSAEGDFSVYGKDKTIESYITPSSARPEAVQMLLIFLIFAIWDFIVDVWKSPKSQPVSGPHKILSPFTGIVTYCAVSLLCAAGAYLVYKAAPIVGLPAQSVAGDVALILLLLLFNRGKVIEHYLCRIFPSEGSRANTKRIPTLSGNLLLVGLLFTFFLSIATMLAVPCFQR